MRSGKTEFDERSRVSVVVISKGKLETPRSTPLLTLFPASAGEKYSYSAMVDEGEEEEWVGEEEVEEGSSPRCWSLSSFLGISGVVVWDA